MASAAVSLTTDGVCDAKGQLHRCDAVVWATGFWPGSLGSTVVRGRTCKVTGMDMASVARVLLFTNDVRE